MRRCQDLRRAQKVLLPIAVSITITEARIVIVPPATTLTADRSP